MPRDRSAYRRRVTLDNTEPRRLDLVRTYYPEPLRNTVLACCDRQRRGFYDRRCRRALCPACNAPESHEIYRKQLATFRACTPRGRKTRLAHEVYTLPPMLRPRVASKAGFAAWRDATLATIREVHGGADIAGILNLHPYGDEHLTKFHPHWDVLVNGYVLTESGRPKEHRPPFVHFDDARRIYTRHLAHAFELPRDQVPRVVDVWFDRKGDRWFTTLPWRVRHLVRYSSRHVYRPQFAWQNPLMERDWWYQPTKDREKTNAFRGRDVIENLLAQQAWMRGKIRRVWFGYLKDKRRKGAADAFARAGLAPADAKSGPNGGDAA